MPPPSGCFFFSKKVKKKMKETSTQEHGIHFVLANYSWIWKHGAFPGVWLIYPVLLNWRKLICLLPAAIVCEQLHDLGLGFCLACLACHWTLSIFFFSRWVITIETNSWAMFRVWDFRVTSPEQDGLFIPSLKTQGPLQKRGLERW